MSTSNVNLIWANKPGCSLAVAEVWIGRERLWFTIYIDDEDQRLKVELLTSTGGENAALVELSEVEHLIESAKRDLLEMARLSN